MEAKPLSKERRIELECEAEDPYSFDAFTVEDVCEILADGRYWREAVKSADIYYVDNVCPWCCTYVGESIIDGLPPHHKHKPDCPYLLAQD